MTNIKHILIFLSIFMLWKTNQIQAQIGVFTTTGDFTLTNTATYEAELTDLTGAGTGHDQIVVTNNAILDGTLDIILDGYTPNASDAFEILTYGGTLSGTFSSINWPTDMVNQGWVIDYGISNPGKVTILGPLNALPVEFLSFTVTQKDGIHLLNWETASEINNDFFAVEFSTNGNNFSVLDKVSSQGNRSESQKYSYSHNPNQSGYHYYRLRQVDLDGKYEYSNILSIDNSLESDVSFFPNPTKGSIFFKETVSELVVYNIKGEEVLKRNNESNTFDLSDLPSGTFLIKINENSILTQKLIINK